MIDYGFSNGDSTGVIIGEVDDTQSDIILWAGTEKELRKLIKLEKERWLRFSEELKIDNDHHYKQFEQLSNQFNEYGKIFTLNLSGQIS